MTVDCEQAANFISSRIDGELATADDALLDAHLAACAACRATLEAAALQDAAMVRAFASRRDAAAALAGRVAEKASALAPSTPRAAAVEDGWQHSVTRWTGWTAAAAAGFIAAMIFMRPAQPPATQAQFAIRPAVPPTVQLAQQSAEPIAQLALASGEVFKCPSGEQSWKPMAPGAGVEPGAKVRTADAAKCELSLPGGSRLRLNSDTELHFTAARDVRLTGGQIWSAVPPDADTLRIAAGDAQVTTGAGGPAAAAAAQLDIARVANAATVTVVEGSARVDGQGQAMTVRGGESLRVGVAGSGAAPPPSFACEPVADPLKETRWLDDLLLLLPADNPELQARVDALMERVTAERRAQPTAGAASGPGPVERDVRARGQSWAPPIARFAMMASTPAEAKLAKRRAAARLLADLATPACISDLIALLGDDDGEVRFHAAAALNRLTGQTLGFSPDRCAATPRDPAPALAWQEWWARNRARHPARP